MAYSTLPMILGAYGTQTMINASDTAATSSKGHVERMKNTHEMATDTSSMVRSVNVTVAPAKACGDADDCVADMRARCYIK